jgi:hypothetical protein
MKKRFKRKYNCCVLGMLNRFKEEKGIYHDVSVFKMILLFYAMAKIKLKCNILIAVPPKQLPKRNRFKRKKKWTKYCQHKSDIKL